MNFWIIWLRLCVGTCISAKFHVFVFVTVGKQENNNIRMSCRLYFIPVELHDLLSCLNFFILINQRAEAFTFHADRFNTHMNQNFHVFRSGNTDGMFRICHRAYHTITRCQHNSQFRLNSNTFTQDSFCKGLIRNVLLRNNLSISRCLKLTGTAGNNNRHLSVLRHIPACILFNQLFFGFFLILFIFLPYYHSQTEGNTAGYGQKNSIFSNMINSQKPRDSRNSIGLGANV